MIISEVAGIKVYWPEAGINTLEKLIPKKAYSSTVLKDTNFDYPGCE